MCYLQNLGEYFKVRLFYSINFFTKIFAFLTEGNLLYWRWIHCFPGGLVVKNLPANERDAGDLSSILGWVDSLEKEMATQSSFLAWKILWTEKLWGCKNSDTTEPMSTFTVYSRVGIPTHSSKATQDEVTKE